VDIVWPRLGLDVPSYIEPFFGSGAMLLGRPGGAGKYETVNDLSGMLVNFWRAVRADPMEVARYADYPVSETDLHARHQWLVDQEAGLTAKLLERPDYWDPKVAGWWVWGKSQWIGDGWCRRPEWVARPNLSSTNGVHAIAKSDKGLHRKIPELHGSKGIHVGESTSIYERMLLLAARLRHVRICAGDFERVLSSASMGTNPTGVAQGIAPCAIYLDPVYKGYEGLYGDSPDETLHDRVLAFCKEHGDNPRLRIVLSGYEDEYALPGWEVIAWKAHGGYANQTGEHNTNAHRERLWVSPHCQKPEHAQPTLEAFFRSEP
jgi:site-specific DNA-adenine methylase